MKFLHRIAYLNVGIYPFTSFFLIVYCFLPALSLFSGQFIVQSLSVTFLTYLLTITITLCLLAVLGIKWSGIELEEWWRNEQDWLIGGTSAHLAAVLQGLLKVTAGIEISFTLTSNQPVMTRTMNLPICTLQMDILNDSTYHNHDGQLNCDRTWHQADNIQRYTAVESVNWWRVLQLLGAGTSLPLRQRTRRPKRTDTYHCFRLVGAHRNHNISSLGCYQSPLRFNPNWRLIHIPLTDTVLSTM